MNGPTSIPQPQREPGIATAEDGLVILDGPDGVAVTMTPKAAVQTGHALIAAAEIAEKQSASGAVGDGV